MSIHSSRIIFWHARRIELQNRNTENISIANINPVVAYELFEVTNDALGLFFF